MQLYKNFIPHVSIIMPTFNRAKYLKRSIDSVILQTFKNWELIIVDDGSEDDSDHILNNFISRDERIRFIKKKKTGVSISRNIGIKVSGGEYITFLDSDDEYKNNHLETRFSEMNNDNSIDCLHGGLEIIGDPFVKDQSNLEKKIHLNECIVGATLFGKKEVFIGTGGFRDISYSSESDFYKRAKDHFKFKKVDFPTYIYHRNTPDSICNNV